VGPSGSYMNVTSSGVGIGTLTPQDKLTVLGKIQIQQDSISNGSNRLVFRGQPGSSYRYSIDNNSLSNNFRIFREDDATTANGVVYMNIDSSGRVTTPYQPAFFASGNQGTITVAVGSYFPFNTLNTTFANSNRNAGYNTSTYLYTAPVTGLYQFYIQIYLNPSSVSNSITWWKNGTQLDYGSDAAINIFMTTNSSTTPSSIMLNGSIILELSANDTIGIKPRTGNPNGINFYISHSTFWGYLIG